jgi:hypothetical protein
MSAVQFIEFGAWAQRLGRLPTIEEIADRYPQRDRSWHYRMRDRLLEAWGIPRSPNCYLRTACAPEAS